LPVKTPRRQWARGLAMVRVLSVFAGK